MEEAGQEILAGKARKEEDDKKMIGKIFVKSKNLGKGFKVVLKLKVIQKQAT